MGAPEVPTFYPGVPPAGMAAELNAKIRDPFLGLLDRPRATLRRAASALDLVEAIHQYIPWDTADEDYVPGGGNGWSAGAAVGGGPSTTLSAAAAVGATSITVTSAAGFTTGMIVRIGGAPAHYSYRTISGVAGNVISFALPLFMAYAAGPAVTQWSAQPMDYTIPVGWSGWWLCDAGVSLQTSAAGAAGLVLIPSISVNNASPTGISGGAGWEGIEPFIPTGASTPKYAGSTWRFYASAGDFVRLDLWYSNESAITLTEASAGLECRLGLVWDSV